MESTNVTPEYRFLPVPVCNMCGESTIGASVLGKRMNRSQGMRPVAKVGICTTVVKCRRCALIFSNPLPVPPDLSQHYGIPAENYWNESYFTLQDDYFSEQIARFHLIAGSKDVRGKFALDIGAGVGKCVKALERSGFEAFAIEASQPFYDRAISKTGLRPAQIQLARLEDAHFADDTFDFITFGAVLEHLYDPSESIGKALSWAKPGGLIHIEVPSSKWLTNRISNLIYALQGLDYASNISPMHMPFHLYEFDLKSFEVNGVRLNYEVAFSRYMVCSTYLPRALDFLMKPLMAATNTGMQLEVWIRKPLPV